MSRDKNAHAKSTAEHPFGASNNSLYLSITRGTAEMDVAAMELRSKGYSYAIIGKTLGVGKETARESVMRQLSRLAEKLRFHAVEVRQMEDMRMDEMLSRNATMIEAIEMDLSMDLEKKVQLMTKLHDSNLKIMDRRAKMFGIDAPVEHNHNLNPTMSNEEMLEQLNGQTYEIKTVETKAVFSSDENPNG